MNHQSERQSSVGARRWILFAAVCDSLRAVHVLPVPIAVLTTDLMRDVPMDMGALDSFAAFFYTYALFRSRGSLLDRFSPAKVMAASIFGPRRGDPFSMPIRRASWSSPAAHGAHGLRVHRALKIISLQFPPDRLQPSPVSWSVEHGHRRCHDTAGSLAQGLGWRTTFLLVGSSTWRDADLVLAFRKAGHGREATSQAGAEWKGQLGGFALPCRRQVWLISWSASSATGSWRPSRPLAGPT